MRNQGIAKRPLPYLVSLLAMSPMSQANLQISCHSCFLKALLQLGREQEI